jgi:hypothetical protein
MPFLRQQEDRTPETKTPPEGGVFCILGGPGRNRTTDTRIFKTRLDRTRLRDSCCISQVASLTPIAGCVKEILGASDFAVPSGKSATQRFVGALVERDGRSVLGLGDRAWTGEVKSGETLASPKSFRDLGGMELPALAVLVERQV